MPDNVTVQRNSIWINAGEISGDLHGALLIKALRAENAGLRLMGMGGPSMRAAGLESFFQVEELSVMGFTEVLGQLPKIIRLLRNIKAKLREERPAALVVIDAPSFHFRLIKMAGLLDIPVYYYISPKVWASRQGRVQFIKKNVRRLISILPFEVEFYQKFGLQVDYVGNPLLDTLDLPALDQLPTVPGRIGFLPGSRRKEVSALMPQFGLAAQILQNNMPDLEFCCVRAPGLDEDFLRSFWPDQVPLRFIPPAERYAAMRSCAMLIAASGTAVLESALIGTPTLIVYRLSALTFHLIKTFFIKVPFIGLPNLIAGKAILPELLQKDAEGENLARHALAWLRSEADGQEGASQQGSRGLQAVRADLADLRKTVGGAGATNRAAEIILRDMGLL
ncbi:MAG: lipid-A-disaccharide synthase [Deltaproteobacteria bacterium]|jgi:lipid-A-disaccharide synthase|nr:lipid-A-disaccharide synthase [Deltaproteobacteria bacterium]